MIGHKPKINNYYDNTLKDLAFRRPPLRSIALVHCGRLRYHGSERGLEGLNSIATDPIVAPSRAHRCKCKTIPSTVIFARHALERGFTS